MISPCRLHVSLTTPILLAGTPRAFAILNSDALRGDRGWPAPALADMTECLVAGRAEAASSRKAFLRGLMP